MFFLKSLSVIVLFIAFSFTSVLADVKANHIVGYWDNQLKKFGEHKKADSKSYRTLLKTNQDGSFVVQDFYTNSNKKNTDIYTVKDITSPDPWEGTITLWYENGQKYIEGHYKEGQPHGLVTGWHENGQKATEENYTNGQLDGVFIQWYENGQKRSHRHFKNGLLDGEQIFFHTTGRKTLEQHYKNGQRDGSFILWNAINGKKINEAYFKEDKLVKMENY